MKHQQPTLRFLGATDTVTGSRYLLEAGGKRVLVDCGSFRARNATVNATGRLSLCRRTRSTPWS